jgi:aspartyl-tRNA(Asn)/glutamyl-tRNA(Gln) amidotransferase subunit B
VRIREVHLEEDPGQYDPTLGSVDFNRSGVPLVEIVTEPDIHSGEEAREFLKSLVRVLEYSGKVRPEAGGAMRADTNISIEGGGRVEIKNINSIHGAYRAIKFELIRQAAKLKRGEQVTRETRAFLESQRVTTPMRTKEMEEDYRFIPDPDIFPLVISPDKVRETEKRMPEPPHLRKQRLIQQYGVPDDDAEVLVSEQALADLFEQVAKQVDSKFAAKWFRTKLKKILNYMGIGAKDVKFTPEQLGGVLRLVEGKKITPEQGEFLLRELARNPASPEELMRRLKLGELISENELDKTVEKIIKENPKVVQDYLSGRSEALNFLTGKVMKLTRGKADPRKIMELLRSKVVSR